MATPGLQVITEYCEAYVDDIRLAEVRQTNPALYLRQTWFFLRVAIALFNHPVEMQTYLLGTESEPRLVEPRFDSLIVTLDSDKAAGDVYEFGFDYTGYAFFTAQIRETEQDGTVYYSHVVGEYDPMDGKFVFGADYPAGTVLEFDFATDGTFVNTLTPEMMDILGTAFGLAWRERFNQDWLSIVSKVEDKSFKEQNRATDKRANTEQIEKMRVSLAGKMRKFEQAQYYVNKVPQTARITIR
jgi:hypothetical protein